MPNDQEYATPCTCSSTNGPTRDALSDGEPEVRAIVQQVLDVLPDGIVVADTRGQVIMSNRAAQDIAGAGVTGRFMFEDDTRGQETYRVCHPDGSPYLTRDLPLQRAIRRGAVVRGEQVLIRHGTTGRETPLVVNSAPLRDAAGITIGGVVTFQDGAMLTNPVQVRAEVIDETAHDLMTSLTSVRGNAALARRRLARSRTPDIAAVTSPLMAIESATRLMASLIGDLRPSMHAQAGESPLLERRPTDLVALLRVLIARQQGLTPHHIRLEAAAPALMVTCDAVAVERAAANLLANAITYSPEGGDIMVGATSEHDATGIWAVLTVQDHGMGIPAEELPHIFERLYRAKNAVGRIHGTGIGLASVRRIVEQHGGTVTAESREGAGSTITIRLPLQRAALAH